MTKTPENPRGAGRRRIEEGVVTFANRIGKLIQARRQELGLSLDRLAERTDGQLSGSQISGYERGIEPGAAKLVWLAHALEVDILDLIPADVRKLIAGRTTAVKLRRAMVGRPAAEKPARAKRRRAPAKEEVEEVESVGGVESVN
jgi:transcriptional regulator with XRE-family HTH domain